MPRTADRVSPLHPGRLTHILREAGELPSHRRVVAVEAEAIGGGYLASLVRLRLGYDGTGANGCVETDSGPSSLVLKRPAEEELPRTVGTAMGLYTREVRFYEEVAPGLDVRTPRCFHAEVDEETGEFSLVLEDLADTEVHAQDDACPVPDVQLALEQAARLHASRWNDPTLAEADWLLQLTCSGVRPWHDLYRQAWDGFLAWDGVVLDPRLQELGDALATSSVDTWIGGYRGPWTLTHADFHLSNLLYRGDPARPNEREVVVVDWQLATHASPVVDVAFLLGRMPTEHRRRVEPGLLRYYHDKLLARGVTGYDFSAFGCDYGRWLWFGVLNAVIASAAYPIAPDELPRHVEKVARFLTQALDHDSLRYIT